MQAVQKMAIKSKLKLTILLNIKKQPKVSSKKIHSCIIELIMLNFLFRFKDPHGKTQWFLISFAK